MTARFTYKSARSGSLIAAVGLIVVVETVGLHVMIMDRSSALAWAVTLSNASIPFWLVQHYRAMGRGAIEVTETHVHVRIGKAISVLVPRSNIASAFRPTFRDIPSAGTTQGADFANVTKNVQPNVLLMLNEPVAVSYVGLIKKRVRRLAMHLDEPDAFLAAVNGP